MGILEMIEQMYRKTGIVGHCPKCGAPIFGELNPRVVGPCMQPRYTCTCRNKPKSFEELKEIKAVA